MLLKNKDNGIVFDKHHWNEWKTASLDEKEEMYRKCQKNHENVVEKDGDEMNDLISVVLPVYNGEQFLTQSIESVIRQTYKEWELLILDDCSTDSTQRLSMEYVQKDPRIHYYRNEKNLRLPRNLNRGFSLAKGDWLTWTSDDNYYYSDAFEKMLRTAKKTGREYIIASSDIVNSDNEIVESWSAPIDACERSIGECVGNACFLYSRNVYERTGDYDPEMELCEDFDYWQRICINFTPAVIVERLYAYRWHDRSLTSTLKKEDISANMLKMLEKNVPKYGKLNYRQKHFLYKKQAECKKILHIDDTKTSLRNAYYSCMYQMLTIMPNRIKRALK